MKQTGLVRLWKVFRFYQGFGFFFVSLYLDGGIYLLDIFLGNLKCIEVFDMVKIK